MSWIYEIEWMDGVKDNISSTRLRHLQPGDRNLIIEVDEHGHDRRFDEIVIPVTNVRRFKVREVR
jgi:hypothetical protein